MADEKTNIKGHTGILSMGGLPIVCLTSTSSSLVAETVEKVNYCTQGETVTTVQSIKEEIQIEGEIMGDVDATEISYQALRTAMLSKTAQSFTLAGRTTTALSFTASITSLSDNFTAGEDATFSATLSVIPTQS